MNGITEPSKVEKLENDEFNIKDASMESELYSFFVTIKIVGRCHLCATDAAYTRLFQIWKIKLFIESQMHLFQHTLNYIPGYFALQNINFNFFFV
jgi:hypothetical protein